MAHPEHRSRTARLKQLEISWSLEQIAGRLQHEDQPLRVSHETIYAFVYGTDGQIEENAPDEQADGRDEPFP